MRLPPLVTKGRFGNWAAGMEVFSSYTPEQVSVAFTRAAKRAGVLDFRFHDLRHIAASWLRMQDADIHTVAQILGHKDLRMAARYQHLSPAFMAEAVGRLDGKAACIELTQFLQSDR